MKTCFSRRELYAHGEPLGDCVTRPKLGGGYVCGFGGSSSSASTQQTFNEDKRIAVQDGVGISGDNNTATLNNTTNTNTYTTNNITDGGIVTRGLKTVDDAIYQAFGFANDSNARALDAIKVNNATNAQGFEGLLNAAENLWDRGEKMIGQTQQFAQDAYTQAQNEAKGTIDNRTIVIIAIAGAAALAFASRRK